MRDDIPERALTALNEITSALDRIVPKIGMVLDRDRAQKEFWRLFADLIKREIYKKSTT